MGKKSCSIIAFAIALTCACLARAETPVLYPGSRCVVADHNGKTADLSIKTTSAIVTIEDMRDANADSELLRRCKKSLGTCRAEEKSSKGRTALTYLAIGIAIGSAFMAGVWVAK